MQLARWQSGHAADCKSANGGSIPPRALPASGVVLANFCAQALPGAGARNMFCACAQALCDGLGEAGNSL